LTGSLAVVPIVFDVSARKSSVVRLRRDDPLAFELGYLFRPKSKDFAQYVMVMLPEARGRQAMPQWCFFKPVRQPLVQMPACIRMIDWNREFT
jgi:hypothetical protein